MSVDQQDGYIAAGDTFRQFEAGNVRQPRLDYREIEATGCQGLSCGPAGMGAGNGRSTELLKSSCDGLTDTVISINNEKFQHSDGGPQSSIAATTIQSYAMVFKEIRQIQGSSWTATW